MIQNRSILYEFLRLQKKSQNPSYPTTSSKLHSDDFIAILEQSSSTIKANKLYDCVRNAKVEINSLEEVISTLKSVRKYMKLRLLDGIINVLEQNYPRFSEGQINTSNKEEFIERNQCSTEYEVRDSTSNTQRNTSSSPRSISSSSTPTNSYNPSTSNTQRVSLGNDPFGDMFNNIFGNGSISSSNNPANSYKPSTSSSQRNTSSSPRSISSSSTSTNSYNPSTSNTQRVSLGNDPAGGFKFSGEWINIVKNTERFVKNPKLLQNLDWDEEWRKIYETMNTEDFPEKVDVMEYNDDYQIQTKKFCDSYQIYNPYKI
ncbi:hypothetical protein TVAG_088980 [Trichomonas vaginalis G3]|uniref:Uncharacterized protein n=1 Tax=Trichomonas vaginalis (strain ATCC PRA-98 / G3) TaxID=412133 RepID=A2G3L4_TRIV3|nr:protein ubiquitination [Trichomonas vaginalis G3]EAX88250.1 hypothetical protein TVAG_088980 [Trichomonas vaginalis G3]KAI5488046.1 protein ubiquitination [Trichomonas vaginalis G3]|eukprot:XP_001301180.1 hypothetical protein [Trichomonas vaginalis G3]